MTIYQWLAEEPAQGRDPLGGWGFLVVIAAVFVVFYLLILRPQRKREQDRQRKREEMISALKKNDHVMTIGGIYGVVVSVSDEAVVLRIDEKSDVRLKVTRDAVSKVVGEDEEKGEGQAPTLGQ